MRINKGKRMDREAKKKTSLNAKRLRKRVVCGFLVLAAIGGGSGAAFLMGGDTEKAKGFSMEGAVKKGDLEMGVFANGTTVGTTDYQLCDFSYTAKALVVEDVLVKSGDSVKKGDVLYQLTEESVAAVREALEDNLVTYKIALAEAEVTYQEAVNAAKTEYKTNCSLETTALTDYEDTIEAYTEKVVEKREVYKEAQRIIKNYPDEIKTAVTEKKTLEKQGKKYKKQLKLQKEKTKSAQKKSEALQQTYENAREAYEKVKAVAEYLAEYPKSDADALPESLKSSLSSDMSEKNVALEKAKKAYEEAKLFYEKQEKKEEALNSACEKAQEKAEALSDTITEKRDSLKKAKKSVTQYRADYLEAVAEETVGKVTAEETYEENVSTYQNAEQLYHSSLKAAEAELAEVKEKLNTAKKQRTAFKALVQENTVRADREGVLDAVSYLSGDTLSRNIPLAGYQDSSVINIEVSVDQSDIAAVKVGNSVNVTLSAVRDTLEGTVAGIEAENVSESVSNVTYSVTVTVDNLTGAIGTGETANVSFVKETLQDVLYVPVNAVKTNAAGSTITAKTTAGTTKEIEVCVGETNGQYIVLESGLKEGDIYVVEMES